MECDFQKSLEDRKKFTLQEMREKESQAVIGVCLKALSRKEHFLLENDQAVAEPLAIESRAELRKTREMDSRK